MLLVGVATVVFNFIFVLTIGVLLGSLGQGVNLSHISRSLALN